MVQLIKRELEKLQVEERDNPEAREKIFMDVIGNDKHGRVLCAAVGIRSTSSSSSSARRHYESEISRLRAEADKRERQHQDRIDQLKHEMETKVDQLRAEADERERRSETRLIRLLQSLGISIPLQSSPDPSPRVSIGHGSTTRVPTFDLDMDDVLF